MIVVDASVLGPAIADDGSDGDAARERLEGTVLYAPELVDLEVASYVRGNLRAGHLDARRAAWAMDDLCELKLHRAPHWDLMYRCWQLRDNLTVYDAVYVALAEALRAPLVTADRRLASAPGVRCEVEVIETATGG